jgi:hypothetical protein
MLLYTDVLTNDELASDAYDPKLIDDIVFEIDCAQIVIKEGEVNTGELGLKFGHKRGTMDRGLAFTARQPVPCNDILTVSLAFVTPRRCQCFR